MTDAEFKAGALDALDVANETAEDFPDGAWFCFMQESARNYVDGLNEHLFIPRYHADENDMVHMWIEERGTPNE